MGAKLRVNNRDTTPKLPLYEDGGLIIHDEDYLLKHDQVYNPVVVRNASALNDLRYPTISPNSLAVAGTPHIGGALKGVFTRADGTAGTGAGALRIPSSLAIARSDAAQGAYEAQPILVGLGHRNQRDTMHQQALAVDSAHDLTAAQEAAVTSMVPLDAVIPGQNIEFTDAQKLCAAELGSELDKTVHWCIFDKLRGQAQREPAKFSAKDEGKKLLQDLNFLYRGASTAQTSQLLQKIIGFSFLAKADSTDSLTQFKESALQLATSDGHKIPEIVLCNIIIAALQLSEPFHVAGWQRRWHYAYRGAVQLNHQVLHRHPNWLGVQLNA